MVLIEFAQLLTVRGWFELVDLVDNTVGAALGYGFYLLASALWRVWRCNKATEQ